jgi:hypothetical protein
MSNALAGVRLDHNNPIPLYYQAARALEEAIEDGRLPRGQAGERVGSRGAAGDP